MAKPATWHRISNVDRETKRGDCTICGLGVPVRIRAGRQRGTECGLKPRRSEKRPPSARMGRADYNALREKQGNACAICRAEVPRLAADHCHQTGFVRGLLCRSCNTGLGLFGDDSTRLAAAIAYLEEARRATGGGARRA